jgi:hypothetical protein
MSDTFGDRECIFFERDQIDDNSCRKSEKPEDWIFFHEGEAPGGKDPPQISDKWLYVFRSKDRQRWELRCEVKADGANSYRVFDGRMVESTEYDQRPEPSSVKPKPSVHLEVNFLDATKKAFIEWSYCFLAFEHRLPVETINNIKINKGVGQLEILQTIGLAGRGGFLGVIDPWTIGEQLRKIYEGACNEYNKKTSLYEGQPKEEAREIRQRHQKVMLARSLVKMIQSDKDLKKLIKPARDPEKYLQGVELTIRRLVEKKEQAVKRMIAWVKQPLWKLLDKALRISREREKKDYHYYVNVDGPIKRQLIESKAGQKYLMDLLATKDYLLSNYVLCEEENPWPDRVEVARKSWDCIRNLFEEVTAILMCIKKERQFMYFPPSTRIPLFPYPAWLSKERRKLVDLCDRLNRTYGRDMIILSAGEPLKEGLYKMKVTKSPLHVGIQVQWNEAVLKTLTSAAVNVAKGLEVINILFDISKVLEKYNDPDAGFRSTTFEIANFLGDLTDAAQVFKKTLLASFKGLTEKALTYVGILGALIDVACAINSMVEAGQEGDTNNMVSYGVLAAGAVLMCFSGVGTVFLATGLLLMAGGTLAASLTKNSEMENFVANCYFGTVYGENRSKYGKWYDLDTGFEYQVKALIKMMCKITIKASNPFSVSIVPTFIIPESKITVRFVGSYREPKALHRFTTVANWGDRTFERNGVNIDGEGPGGFAEDGSAVSVKYYLTKEEWENNVVVTQQQVSDWIRQRNISADGSGDLESIWRSIPEGKQKEDLMYMFLKVSCEVRVDYFGDGATLIPESGPIPQALFDDPFGGTSKPGGA